MTGFTIGGSSLACIAHRNHHTFPICRIDSLGEDGSSSNADKPENSSTEDDIEGTVPVYSTVPDTRLTQSFPPLSPSGIVAGEWRFDAVTQHESDEDGFPPRVPEQSLE